MRKIFFSILLISMCLALPENPYKLAVAEGIMYIADPLQNQIRAVQGETTTLFSGDFLYPQAVAVYGQQLYLVDTGHHRISEYIINKESIQFVRHIPVAVLYPRDCALSPDGQYLYILDGGHNKIIRVSLSDVSNVLEFGEFNGPYGLCTDPYGAVYVADTNNHRIVKYTADGKYVASFGREGTRQGQLYYPKDVAVGFSRAILVANSGAGRIDRFTESGQYLGQVKIPDTGDIRGLCLTSEGNLYYSLPEKQPAYISLKHVVQSLSAGPNVFSPNHDGVLDIFTGTAEVVKPSNLSLILVTAGIVQTIEGPKNVSGLQSVDWTPENIKAGKYHYYFLVQDYIAQFEPAVIQGEVIVDCTPPIIDSVNVSPPVLALNEEHPATGIVLQLSISEPASAYVDIYRLVQDDEYWFAQVQTDLAENPVVTWNGRNKYQETYTGRYVANIAARDAAGNESQSYQVNCAVSVTHPLIGFVSANARVHKPGEEFTVHYSLLLDASVHIILKDMQGAVVKEIYSGDKKAGDYILILNLTGLNTGDYSLVIEATHGSIVDKYYYAVIIDITPPVLVFTLSRSEMFTGGIDTIIGSGVLDEDGRIDVAITDVNGTKVAQVISQNVLARKKFQIEWAGLDDLHRPVPAGVYVLLITATDLVGNAKKTMYPVRLTSSGPKIIDTVLSTDLISLQSADSNLKQVRFSYTIDESAGDLFVTTRILKSGVEIALLSNNQKRSRGINFDYWQPSPDAQDGVYMYELTVQDAFKHTYLTNGEIFVANTLPSAIVTQSTPVIYPLGSRAIIPEVIITAQGTISNVLAQYDLMHVGDKGAGYQYQKMSILKGFLAIGSVREYIVSQSATTFSFAWDGKDALGRYVVDGVYPYTFIITDATGVASSQVTGSIIVANAQEKILGIQLSEITLNPLAGPTTTAITIQVGSFPASQNISMKVIDQASRVLRNFSAQQFIGSGNYTFDWDGLTDSGYQVGDGQYTAVINIKDEFENNFDYIISQNVINSIDDLQITNADGTKYSKPSITKLSLTQYEVNYVKNIYSDERVILKNDGNEYFYIDYPQIIDISYNGADPADRNSALVNPPGVVIAHNKYIPGSHALTLAGRYRFFTDIHDNNTYKLSFSSNDVWSKNMVMLSVEKQIDNLYKNNESPQAYIRRDRLAMISSNVSSILRNHQVTINVDMVKYQSRLKGQTLGSAWLTLSQGGKYCSEPSITAADGDNVYVVWIQRDTAGGNPYVVCQKVPEKYQPVLDAGTATFTPMSLSLMAISAINLFAEVSPSVPILVAPKENEILSDDQVQFVWQAPTWAVMTSTNYVVSLSDDINSFVGAIAYDLSPAQLRFSGVSYNYVQFTCPDTLDNAVYCWKVGAKDSPAAPIRGESLVQEFQVLPDLKISGEINYPNPFKERTTIRYKLSQDADVEILIFDATGSLVRRLEYLAGTEGGQRTSWSDLYNDVVWEAHNDFGSTVVNGVYVYEIAAQSGKRTVRVRGKMLKWR